MADFVLKGHICYSESKNELITRENAYVVCVGGKSKGVFTELPQQYAVLPLKDYSDCLIVPGMIDLHIHAPQYAFRGMCMDLELMDWLNCYTFPEEAKYMALEYAERAYAIFVNALKASATTRAVVFATRHRPATELLMALMEESGLISFVGLLAPHGARLLTKNNRLSTMLLSGFIGGILLCGADILARAVAATELPVSIFTSLLGAPFLIFLIFRGRKQL